MPIALALVASLSAASRAIAQETAPGPWRDVPRVVVFGDVHGAYEALVELLQTAGVVGSDLRWTGGATHVVSLGDLLDRGPGARRVLDLVMRLQGEAQAAGGRLHVVLGNHEVMNLVGDWRYLSAADYAAFAADEPAAVRAAAYAAFALGSEDGESAATRERFDRAFPLGYFARQAAFAPTGRYGKWLLALPAIVVINRTAYVHGGLSQLVADSGLDLNTRIRAKLERYLTLRAELIGEGVLASPDRQHDVETALAALPAAAPALAARLEQFIGLGDAAELGLGGPLWYRGSVYCKPLLETPTLEASLAKLGAERVIVGHTPTGDRRVHALYDGRLIAADTGMLSEYYRGRGAALVLANDEIAVQYIAPPQRVAVDGDASSVVHGRTEAQLRAALELGAVVTVERDEDAARWSVQLRHEDATIEAVFYPRGRDGAGDRELAAAALDDLLGMDLVAPTVARAIEGESGALQLRYRGSVSEAERVARGLAFSGWCPIDPQVGLMYTFDALVATRGRTVESLLFVNDQTDLLLTDHRQAFGTERIPPQRRDADRLVIPAALAARLRALDEQRLTTALGQWLDARRIRALLARRDQLLLARPVR